MQRYYIAPFPKFGLKICCRPFLFPDDDHDDDASHLKGRWLHSVTKLKLSLSLHTEGCVSVHFPMLSCCVSVQRRVCTRRKKCVPTHTYTCTYVCKKVGRYVRHNYMCLILRSSVTSKKSPNIYKSCPKMISLEKFQILTPLLKLPKNVGDLGTLIVAKGFEKLPKVQ